ncbi:pirin family protein [Burkholderia glumae]|uniref:Pirin family protein n=1 Tax=Burkholderia glumae TaxID=337 RepID=A0AAP9Y180_BURGL|nr:pirin family protein [Burkholderia glumae]ACR29623.1 Pirin-like protein [Burkholderia glumae BGR1]AJY65397.1 pirin family protein [Burkholderia glumae LMG 2196 = ATCC 33617]KHJ64748.1 pirin [Burkholderia glumae]MCM2482708.1 pirin family protein [Burkholderia glumae]MCM2507150.1 pirin family protein [Burkholderia glumae]
MPEPRSIQRVYPSLRATEGAGFQVHRPFPTRLLADFDPFLLLDEMGPVEYAPGAAKGAPDHPHRGFETVTYLLDGHVRHRDSAGHTGELRAGDVQWMTAGAGLIHSEMPDPAFAAAGGRIHGIQLWVNLRRSDKRLAPRYQELAAADIPRAYSADGRIGVKVIAGEALGARAAIETQTPLLYLHLTLQPRARIGLPVPRDHRVFAYPIAGAGHYGASRQVSGPRQMIVFNDDGDTVELAAGEAPLDVLLLGGRPISEPIVRYGPFVMNTEQEIRDAVADYQAGRMGAIQG